MGTKIQLAAREMRRLVGDAVGKSFFKTLTEPLTNADSILKKQFGVSHAAGLIDKLLTLNVGDRVNTAELKAEIKKGDPRRIKVEIVTAGRRNRFCRVTDAGTGMTCLEMQKKFSTYAAAKAKGERTRSLFGRGALDVLLYHQDAKIYSVRDNILSICRFFWEKSGNRDPMCECKEVGRATKFLLASHQLPVEIVHHGTVVQFVLKDGTHIPVEDQILSKISGFYMLRLIAADPNTEVLIHRTRADGEHVGKLEYDFPLGEVIGRVDDSLELKGYGDLPVSILVARSDVQLEMDPQNIDRREGGLLFVEDKNAVLDVTLLPEYERNPYLKHVYGFVRVNGLRNVLEAKLEDEEAEAVLTPTRDGFDRKNEITKHLFALVGHHVKPWYEAEEKLQRKGGSKRSEALDQRINDALKAINQFNAEETDEEGTNEKQEKPRSEAIYFGINSLRLYTGVTRRISVYVNYNKVNDGEIVLFESDREELKIEPDSSVVNFSNKRSHQRIYVTVTCDVKGLTGKITALSLDKNGKELRAELQILGVDDSPVFEAPEDIAFAAPRYSGDPNRACNNASLLVNLDCFNGMPTVTFILEDIVGKVTLSEERERLDVRVTQANVMAGRNVARLVVSFGATGWGQHAVLRARAKRSDGGIAEAKCKLKFEKMQGDQKFSDFLYEDLERPVLGDVAGDKLYVNSGYPLHRQIFGTTEDEFHKSLETDAKAQIRAVSVLVETAVFHTATTKHQAGGRKGLYIDSDDPIGSLRPYLDESKMKLEPKIYQALVK
jgi:hypothetical protein